MEDLEKKKQEALNDLIAEMRAKVIRKQEREYCANTKLSFSIDEEDETGEIKKSGCGNKKRNGSKYCQPCSDKYHAKA